MATATDLLSKTEIKKAVYRQKPIATFCRIRMGVAYYKTSISTDNDSRLFYEIEIPVSDMGDADFGSEMDAKLLLRWIGDAPIGFSTPTKID